MIAADTSTLAHLTNGLDTWQTRRLGHALLNGDVLLPPVVVTEYLSGPELAPSLREALNSLRVIELDAGYWWRAGDLRRRVLAQGRRAKLGDALVAQACLDAGLPLLASDGDFSAFQEHAGLELLVPS